MGGEKKEGEERTRTELANNMKMILAAHTHAGVSALRVTMTVALMRSSLAGEQPARGFNWESEQVLAVHQIGGLDGYFKWPDMNYRREPWLCCAY